MKKHWFLLFLLITGCNHQTLKNITSKGLTKFHPQKENWLLSHQLLNEPQLSIADTSWLNIFSDQYKYLNEEPLYTHFRNAEIVRVLFSESFDNHSLFKFIKKDEKVLFNEMELQNDLIYYKRDSSISSMGYYKFNSTYDSIIEYQRITGPHIDNHVVIGEYDPILSDTTRSLSIKDWNKLMDLINSEEFRNLPITDQHCCSDSYNMTIEIHNAKGYHLYTRQRPKEPIVLEIIQLLSKLSTNENFKELHEKN